MTTTRRKDFFNTDRDNELGFRSFRIGGKGNIYENLIYNVEFELRGTNSSISYKDIYMEQQELPYIGHLRVGHFKEPIGLEEFGSDLYLTYMEKSPATSAFAPARNFGVMVWDTTRRMPGYDRGSPACSGPIRPIRRPIPASGAATTTTGASTRARPGCPITMSPRTAATWRTWAAATASGTSAAIGQAPISPSVHSRRFLDMQLTSASPSIAVIGVRCSERLDGPHTDLLCGYAGRLM